MNRRLLVLKMLTLAIEEIVQKSGVPTRKRVAELVLAYGHGVNLEPCELKPFFDQPVNVAVVADPDESCSCCECEKPGAFCSGVPGILAKVENCRVMPGARVEACDLCERYPNDEAARQKLGELGMIR